VLNFAAFLGCQPWLAGPCILRADRQGAGVALPVFAIQL
jgi:hypothetical protein